MTRPPSSRDCSAASAMKWLSSEFSSVVVRAVAALAGDAPRRAAMAAAARQFAHGERGLDAAAHRLDALLRESCDLGQYIVEWPADFLPACERHDAVGAEFRAAFHD